jgi:hypothetical protein
MVQTDGQLSFVISGCAFGAASLKTKFARSATTDGKRQLNIEQRTICSDLLRAGEER